MFAGDALSPSVLGDLFVGAQMVDILRDPEEAEPTVRVCFFGVAYDVRETIFKAVGRIGFEDVFASSKEAAGFLKAEKKCNVIVLLTHQFSKEDCQLSKELGTDVDLIFGGHDHTSEFTSYAKAASDRKTQGSPTVWLSDQGKVESVDAKLLAMTDAAPPRPRHAPPTIQ